MRQSQKALARGGRIVVYGFSGDSGDVTINLPELSAGRQSILPNLARLDRESLLAAYEELSELLRTDGLSFLDKVVVPFDQAADAHRMIADRANIGKILLKVFPVSANGTDLRL